MLVATVCLWAHTLTRAIRLFLKSDCTVFCKGGTPAVPFVVPNENRLQPLKALGGAIVRYLRSGEEVLWGSVGEAAFLCDLSVQQL